MFRLTDLPPNTVYQVQSRISQVFGTINYTESQSPYGDAVNITTGELTVSASLLLIPM